MHKNEQTTRKCITPMYHAHLPKVIWQTICTNTHISYHTTPASTLTSINNT